MEEEKCVTVIIKLLNELLNPNVVITESQVANLIRCLTGIPGDVVTSTKLNNILMTWLSEAISKWEIKFNPNPAVLSLALNLSVYLSSDEQVFLQLNNQNIFHRFIKLIKKALSEMNATPNVGYIRLMSAFLKHNSGCQWIICSSHWSEIILLTLSSPENSDFAQAGYTFVSKLIANSASINLEFCNKVINLIIAPIIDIAASADKNIDNSMIQNRKSSFSLVIVVLENLLEERKVTVCQIVLKVISDINFELHLYNLKKQISDEYASFPITTIIHILAYYKLITEQNKLQTSCIGYETFFKITKNIIDFMEVVVKSGAFSLFIEVCVASHRYCVKLGPLSPRIKTKDNIITSLQEQALLCELYPCVYLSNKIFGLEYEHIFEDDIRENTIRRALKRFLPLTIRFIFMLRDIFETNFSVDQSIMSLNYFLNIRDEILSKEIRTMTLQLLITCFEDISIAIKCRPEEILQLPGNETYILSLMKTITILLKEFDVNWQDIFETMLLLDITTTILQFQSWEKEMYVCGFNLIGLAFSKHLTINMALLTDHFKEKDYLEDIITMIEEKLNHNCWEVRSSAVDVVGAISKNVKRFPWLTTLLINKNVPILILPKAFKDEEAAVRISTLTCLEEMTKVDQLWNILQENRNFYDDLSLCLYVDPDPTVRSKAAALVANIYENQEIPSTNLFAFYDLMTYSATEDPSNEVKISSIQFWKKVADNCLVLQGMLDGEFPEVTFSKQTRKIVVLDNTEIAQRLYKVLEELSDNGCLAVLSSALQDDPEVRNVVITVMDNFIHQLKKYKILDRSFDMSDENDENLFSSTLQTMDISSKILGRKPLSPEIFLQVLNKHLLLVEHPEPTTISKQLELFLEEILNQS